MANTYIHTLPDTIASDPNSYTILDFKNQYDQYVTGKLSLSALSEYTIDAYVASPEHQRDVVSTNWVNSNSANMVVNTLTINNSADIFNFNPFRIFTNTNDTVTFFSKNFSNGTFARNEIFLQNDLFASTHLGILGSNHTQTTWTISEGKEDSYLYSLNGDLVIGANTPNKNIILYTGGPFAGNERIVIFGDGSQKIGLFTASPNENLTVAGNISSQGIIYDENGNSNDWNSSYSYAITNSGFNNDARSFINNISSNLVLKTGSLVTGSIFTTNTLTANFNTDEFVTKRYVDAVALESTISGNFVPSLYYTKTNVDDLLNNPNSVYSTWNSTSSLELQSRLFVNSNSAKLIDLNTLVFNNSSSWNSVYSYVNQASSNEENQQEVVSFILNNSSNILNVNTTVNVLSTNWNSVYSQTNSTSSSELEVRTFVNNNSSNQSQAFSYVSTNSAKINDTVTSWNINSGVNINTNTFVQLFSSGIVSTNSNVNSNSANWNSVYSSYNSASSTLATRNFVQSNFLPLTGGKVIGQLFSNEFAVGNSVAVGNPPTLGTVVRKMEIFDFNGNSIGFIPIYNSIT